MENVENLNKWNGVKNPVNNNWMMNNYINDVRKPMDEYLLKSSNEQ